MKAPGLNVVFDGKYNLVSCDGEFKKYPIGGLVCEYARLNPHDIKKYITNNPYYAEDFKTHCNDAMLWFCSELIKDKGEITGAMVTAEFASLLSDYYAADEHELKELLDECNSTLGTPVTKSILKNTGYEQYGVSTVGQAMLTSYSTFMFLFRLYMIAFDLLTGDRDPEGNQAEGFFSMYDENVDLQKIDFRIMLFDGKFHSMYTISSSVSLILFEAAHAMDARTNFVKCKNCGKYFVPLGRSDSVYCGYLAPNAEGKTCRDIGAQATRARMLKNDTVAQEYRRLYMRLKMACKRHPDDMALKEKFDELSRGMKERRQRKESGELTSDDILEWLATMDN